VELGRPVEADGARAGRVRDAVDRGVPEKVTAKNIDLERWKRKYPWLARQLGLP
jgi:hypothetical protein